MSEEIYGAESVGLHIALVEINKLRAELEMFKKNQRSNVIVMNENSFLESERDQWRNRAIDAKKTLEILLSELQKTGDSGWKPEMDIIKKTLLIFPKMEA